MTDLKELKEKVKVGIEHCSDINNKCMGCPYYFEEDLTQSLLDCLGRLFKDVNILLADDSNVENN